MLNRRTRSERSRFVVVVVVGVVVVVVMVVVVVAVVVVVVVEGAVDESAAAPRAARHTRHTTRGVICMGKQRGMRGLVQISRGAEWERRDTQRERDTHAEGGRGGLGARVCKRMRVRCV